MAEKYTKLTLLGSGTFGRAWLVKRNRDEKQFVCKEVTVSGASEKDKDLSLREISTHSRCRYLNVILYKEAFVSRGMLNIIMEYADGGDLEQYLARRRGKLLTPEAIADIFVQLCFALKYIHKLNILHRDLKTQNIFLMKHNNIVKLGDFGIARILENDEDLARTAIGTPYYISPEIFQNKPYNNKSDMWAAGCVLYQLCCLQRPFKGNNISSLILDILYGTYDPIPRSCGRLLTDLVSVLLKVEANERPTAQQVLGIPKLQPYIDLYLERINTFNCQQYESPVIQRNQPRSDENQVDCNEENKRCASPMVDNCQKESKVEMVVKQSVLGQENPTYTPNPRKHSRLASQVNNIKDEQVKKRRKTSVMTPSPRGGEDIIKYSYTPSQQVTKKMKPPKISVYRDILKRQAIYNMQQLKQHNSPTPIHTESCGQQKEISATTVVPLSLVNQILLKHCSLTSHTAFEKMESLSGEIETLIGKDKFRTTVHHIKEVVQKDYNSLEEKLDCRTKSIIPLFIQFIQLETCANSIL